MTAHAATLAEILASVQRHQAASKHALACAHEWPAIAQQYIALAEHHGQCIEALCKGGLDMIGERADWHAREEREELQGR